MADSSAGRCFRDLDSVKRRKYRGIYLFPSGAGLCDAAFRYILLYGWRQRFPQKYLYPLRQKRLFAGKVFFGFYFRRSSGRDPAFPESALLYDAGSGSSAVNNLHPEHDYAGPSVQQYIFYTSFALYFDLSVDRFCDRRDLCLSDTGSQFPVGL